MLHIADEAKNALDYVFTASISAVMTFYNEIHPYLVTVSLALGIVWYSIRIGEWVYGKIKGTPFNPLDH